MNTLTENLVFRSIEDIKAAISEIKKPETTFERLKELQNYFVENEEKTAVEIVSKLTIDQINRFIHVRTGSKKAAMVKDMTEAITQSFDICEGLLSYSWTYGEDEKIDRRKEALKKRFDSTTPEMYQEWKDKRAAKAAAFKKALENPETIDEFKTFVRYKGEAALTSEQREIFDELRTGITKEQREAEANRRAKVSAVEIDSTEMIILETTHTKKNIPLWVVRLSDRVERHVFQELNDRAKKLGGYYSSYRGNGAIAGFTFERKEGAELFVQIKDGDVNAADLRKAINAERTQERVENLQAKAESINEKATDSLNKDRKDNTVRRARMASNAEKRAAAVIVFSVTLNKIAEGIQAGTVKHLQNLSTIAQLEELENILSLCKWRYIREKGIKSEGFEYSTEVVDFAEYPNPTIYKAHILSTLNKLQHDKGKKLAAARMVKRINRLTNEQEFLTVTEGQCLEDFKILFLWPSAGIDKWECERYKNAHLRMERIKRLGITTIFELRAALRELIRIKQGIQLTDEQKKQQQVRELERKFVSAKIDGFFPTPEGLAAEIVAKAAITEGETVLEPSAGLGHLAEAITEAHPENKLTCLEIYRPLAEALTLKGFEAENTDFLTHSGSYDKIVMNPPFENLQDIDHVLHAWSLLNSGGRIVAIMAGNKKRETAKVQNFMQLVDQFGTWEDNPVGSFSSAFRPTGVHTITVILDKP